VLYRNQQALDKASLIKYATELGLNAKQFELDFNDAKAIAEVRKDQSDGRDYGVTGTPTIFVNGIKVQRLSAEAFDVQSTSTFKIIYAFLYCFALTLRFFLVRK
jgi:protein-disulfide isomerase